MTASLTPEELAALLASSRRVVALTGAGISTAAGIPDFRGPRGLYVTRRYDPEKVFDIGWFRREPRWFYEFSADFVAALATVEPTFTHRFLAALERGGRLAGVVTQNIDGLHTVAGSRQVIELHGSYRTATCLGCGKRLGDLTPAWWQQSMAVASRPPVVCCPACGGVVKPDIVFFGEPVAAYETAEVLVRQGDLLLVLGSSLAVTPASYLPYAASAPTAVVTRGDLAVEPPSAWRVVDADLDAFFRRVASLFVTFDGVRSTIK